MQYCQHSRHLATSCHINLKERQSSWPRGTLFGKEHVINMQIGNNFGFVLAQRTNGQNLSRIDWVSNFLWIFKEFHPILCLDPCIKVVRNKKSNFFSSLFDRILWDKSNEPCPTLVRYCYSIKITPQIFYFSCFSRETAV